MPARVTIASTDAAWRPPRTSVQRVRSSSSRSAPSVAPASIATPRMRSGGATPIHSRIVGAKSIEATSPSRRVEADVGLPRSPSPSASAGWRR